MLTKKWDEYHQRNKKKKTQSKKYKFQLLPEYCDELEKLAQMYVMCAEEERGQEREWGERQNTFDEGVSIFDFKLLCFFFCRCLKTGLLEKALYSIDIAVDSSAVVNLKKGDKESSNLRAKVQ